MREFHHGAVPSRVMIGRRNNKTPLYHTTCLPLSYSKWTNDPLFVTRDAIYLSMGTLNTLSERNISKKYISQPLANKPLEKEVARVLQD